MTREEKALHPWKSLVHAGRETMTLEEFTARVNEYKGGTYQPGEFRTILLQLQNGELQA